MLVAARDFSLGEKTIARGDRITDEQIATLPPRRLDILRDQRYVADTTDTEMEETVKDLAARVARLERATDLTGTRKRAA